MRARICTGTLSGRDGEPVVGAAITLTATDVGGRGCRQWPVVLRAPFLSVRRRLPSASESDWKGLACAPVQPQPWSGGFITGSKASRNRTSGRSPPPAQGARMSVHTLPVVPGKTSFANLKQFPVTAGAAYTLDTSLSAPATAEHAGYVTITLPARR
jgi:hypothetical protein